MSNTWITLSIQVDEDGRRQLLQSGQKICIVRALESDDEYVVACAVFNPFGPQTDILFYPEWKVYVTQGGITSFQPVKMQIAADLNQGQQCIFDGVGFGQYASAYSGEVFGLENDAVATVISAGLAQSMDIGNGTAFSVINIAALPYNEISYFQPLDAIRIFIAKGIGPNEVLPATLLRPELAVIPAIESVSSIGPYLTVPLQDDTVIHFDDARNCFAPGPLLLK